MDKPPNWRNQRLKRTGGLFDSKCGKKTLLALGVTWSDRRAKDPTFEMVPGEAEIFW